MSLLMLNLLRRLLSRGNDWLIMYLFTHSLKIFLINDWFSFTLNYQVSEAIQVGVQAIKECNINVEEVQDQLQELDEHIKAQKEVADVLGNASHLFNRTNHEGFIVITIPGHLSRLSVREIFPNFGQNHPPNCTENVDLGGMHQFHLDKLISHFLVFSQI